MSGKTFVRWCYALTLVMLGVCMGGLYAQHKQRHISLDLNDLPPEAVAPRNHSGAEWI